MKNQQVIDQDEEELVICINLICITISLLFFFLSWKYLFAFYYE